MSGSINIGWKKTDGTFEVMSVWTNAILRLFHDPEFMKGDTRPLEGHFAAYRSKQIKKDGYGPGKPVPASYGFILIDEQERKILDWDGYTTVWTVMPFDLGFDQPTPQTMHLDRRTALLPFVNGARYLTADGWVDMDVSTPFTEDTYGPLVRTIKASVKMDNPIIELKLDFPGWEVVDLPQNSAAAFLTLKAAVSECADLSEQDEKAWLRYEKSHYKKADLEAAKAPVEPAAPALR